MDDERVFLTADEAIARLPDGPMIHCHRNPAVGILLGADWSREDLIAHIRAFFCEESGPAATAMGMGLCVNDKKGLLFVETRKAT